jgi:hypothetical protein
MCSRSEVSPYDILTMKLLHMLLHSNSEQIRKKFYCIKDVFVSLGVLKWSLSMMENRAVQPGRTCVCIYIEEWQWGVRVGGGRD